MTTIDDLLFAVDWLECYEVGEDDEDIAAAKERAIAFLNKEITKRQLRRNR